LQSPLQAASPSFIDDLYQEDQSKLIGRDAALLREELKDFNKYKLACKKAECDNQDKINMLWSFKKIFTVPWLIAYDQLFV